MTDLDQFKCLPKRMDADGVYKKIPDLNLSWILLDEEQVPQVCVRRIHLRESQNFGVCSPKQILKHGLQLNAPVLKRAL